MSRDLDTCLECELAKAAEHLTVAKRLAITEQARTELKSMLKSLPQLAKLEVLARHDQEDGIT